jgi:hypothetical protein
MFTVLAVLCYIFAIADIALFYIFDIDITGFSFSPVIACGLGYLFSYLGGNKE